MAFQQHFVKTFKENPQVFSDIIGQAKAKEQLKGALITGRHVLIHGPPGIGKTTMVKNVAKLLPKGEDHPFIRVQGSPDLTSEDLLGDIDPVKALKFGPLSKEAFEPGKIFKADKGILFFDEVNRCSEKLQNALLQALEEGIVTIGSYDVDLTANFIFIGTINPQDSSTEKLNEAFMDRFDVIQMEYPETDKIEKRITLLSANKTVCEGITFPEKHLDFLIEFIRSLRNPDKLSKFPSVRATIGVYERACANALIRGNSEVTLRDIKDTFNSVLAHRIELKPSLKYLQTPEEMIGNEFESFAKMHQISSEEYEEEDAYDDVSDST